MNFESAFSFQFQDPDWVKKILIAALCTLIPVAGGLFLLGWTLEIARRVIKDEPSVLPDLELSENIVRGFQAAVISLVYMIPIFLLALPIGVVSGFASNSNSNLPGAIFLIVFACFGILIAIYSIFLGLLLPAAYGNFLAKGSLGAGLEFGEVFSIFKSAIGPYFMVLLGNLISGLIASLGTVVCLVGVVATTAYGMTIYGHLIGQAYKSAVQNRAF